MVCLSGTCHHRQYSFPKRQCHIDLALIRKMQCHILCSHAQHVWHTHVKIVVPSLDKLIAQTMVDTPNIGYYETEYQTWCCTTSICANRGNLQNIEPHGIFLGLFMYPIGTLASLNGDGAPMPHSLRNRKVLFFILAVDCMITLKRFLTDGWNDIGGSFLVATFLNLTRSRIYPRHYLAQTKYSL